MIGFLQHVAAPFAVGAIAGIWSWHAGFKAGTQSEQDRFRRYVEQRRRTEHTR